LLYAFAFAAILALRWLWPIPIHANSIDLLPGLGLLVLGVGIVICTRRAMQVAGTNIDPTLPTTAVVASGAFHFSRNPLYVALTLVYLGLTLLANTQWGLVMLVPLLLVMHRGVVLREERYLEQKFGETYRAYRRKVRRYL